MKKIKFKDFPDEIKQWLGDQQEAQGNKRDLSVFENDIHVGFNNKGINWGCVNHCDNWFGNVLFCHRVLEEQDFDYFFKRFSKKEKSFKERVMWVSDFIDFVPKYKRVVFMEKNDIYLAWVKAETIEEAKKKTRFLNWDYAKEYTEPLKLTLKEIADKFGVDEIEIVDENSN